MHGISNMSAVSALRQKEHGLDCRSFVLSHNCKREIRRISTLYPGHAGYSREYPGIHSNRGSYSARVRRRSMRRRRGPSESGVRAASCSGMQLQEIADAISESQIMKHACHGKRQKRVQACKCTCHDMPRREYIAAAVRAC